MSSDAPNRVVVLASADTALRERLRASLTSMRWHVREASGGAEAMAYLEESRPEALLVDGWLPDLEVSALSLDVRQLYPHVDLVRLDGSFEAGASKSARRHELLQALRESIGSPVPDAVASVSAPVAAPVRTKRLDGSGEGTQSLDGFDVLPISGLIGKSEPMRELTRLIRLVAPHSARVLIEGETGTGKELVATALHALSPRSQRSFVVLNCAAIPEALLEAELFGHTRGAFTGAVQSRMGRIEAAHGGTLFLDEIGEMPLPLQAKLLRFLENGELQRVGENEAIRVDVRVIAATHQQLDERAEEGSFRLDLLHRLAVFPIQVPSLRERIDDLLLLIEYFLSRAGKKMPRKSITPMAIERLQQHSWPGNVRELDHVLQRACILTGPRSEITSAEILLRRAVRSTY